MILKSLHTLLLDLENTKQVIVEKFNKMLKAKGKALTALPNAKSTPKKKASGTQVIKSLRRYTVRSFASVEIFMVVHTRCITQAAIVAMTRMVSPMAQPLVSPLMLRSPTKNKGARSKWPSWRPFSRLM
jgi:hypothetical protein